jgi:transcription initiation factor TFIIIB Brf1 subunit/transcription initiation factor TFIIB
MICNSCFDKEVTTQTDLGTPVCAECKEILDNSPF